MTAGAGPGSRAAELCRRLKPILGQQIDILWAIYVADTTAAGRAEVEQMLEALAAEHLGSSFERETNPFPPPPKEAAAAGEIPLGEIIYAGRTLYPLHLKQSRLPEHVLVAGRSGSGKTTLVTALARSVMQRGIRLFAIDWKRSYRDLCQLQPDLRVFTVGRDVAPIRFNPLIPPAGCSPAQWLKLVIDVLSRAYIGGEGVISLLTRGLDELYHEMGVYDGEPTRWPTTGDLLAWLTTQKLKGRAAQWAASAERILLAMTYGDFADVINTQDNTDVAHLLDHHVVLEMDGLSSDTERTFFTEALMLYLYRFRLAGGPRRTLTNMVVLEEAHHLLLAKQAGASESILEQSIRLMREYGLGFVFVDQSAHTLSKTAFANTYAMIALNQKLAADVRTMAGAMSLDDEQKQALTRLPVGQAVVRLADDHAEPFMIQIPPSPLTGESVSDEQLRARSRNRALGLLPPWDPPRPDNGPGRDSTGITGGSGVIPSPPDAQREITAVPAGDKEEESNTENPTTIDRERFGDSTHAHPHPPAPDHDVEEAHPPEDARSRDPVNSPNPAPDLSREAVRFLADVAGRPLSTTVARYERLHLSRRRGNAIRQQLTDAGLIVSLRIPTRSGQTVLQELTDAGRSLADRLGLAVGPSPTVSLEHRYWAHRAAEHFANEGYEIDHEYQVDGNGAVDLLATRGERRIAVEIETGKSDIHTNLTKAAHAGFERTIVLATSPEALDRCRRVLREIDIDNLPPIELMSWLDVS